MCVGIRGDGAGGEGGVDLVVDVGGASTISHAIDAVRIGGRIMMVGNLTGRNAQLPRIDRIFYKAVHIQGLVVGHRKAFQDMCTLIEDHKIRPVVGQIFEYQHAEEAFKFLESSPSRFGKVVIRVQPDGKSSRGQEEKTTGINATLSSKL
mmetsp:Transcript_516/g.768  ORF Transcript_516/g.768 Transcript_516/m.768 type:complete len:150 (-) Transcript_516:112-561(-)